MNKTDVEIGAIVRRVRVDNQMTQLELSTRLGYGSMQFVSLFERGLSKVPHEILGKLSVIFGKDLPLSKIRIMLVTQFESDLVGEIKTGKEKQLRGGS